MVQSPKSIVDVPFTGHVPSSKSELRSQNDVSHAVLDLVPGWQSATLEENLQVSIIKGGLTNKIYRVDNPNATPSAVLVRVFGGTDIFTLEDRERETRVFEQLGCAGIGPELIAVFRNGRVEQFKSARALTLTELEEPFILGGIAEALARFHKFEPTSFGSPKEVGLWLDVETWMESAVRLHRDGAFRDLFSLEMEDCVASVTKLRDCLTSTHSCPVLFCHNDLTRGNILLADDKTISFVDFEYSAYNYRGYDIGNFFCESMGGGCEGEYIDPLRYPSEETRRAFCSAYLREAEGEEPAYEAVLELMEEAERFGLLSHLCWGFWALVESNTSKVDFPYIRYAEQRFSLYFEKCDTVLHR